MSRLSLAMIVKNEEDTLARVLGCVRNICDELIVVDTGSTDGTVEIAENLGACVYHFDWINDFSAARNEAFRHCNSEWIMWLDADDVLGEEAQHKILALKASLDERPEVDGIFTTYNTRYNEQNQCMVSIMRERILRNRPELTWEGVIHEVIMVPHENSLFREDIVVEHRPLPGAQERKSGRNLGILEKQVAAGNRSLRTLMYYGLELHAHGRFAEAIQFFKETLEADPAGQYRYDVIISILLSLRAMGDISGRFEEWCLKAIAFEPKRAEAYIQLGSLYYEKMQWEKAIPFFRLACGLRRPIWGMVSEPDYSWLPHDYLSLCYERVGEYEKALNEGLKALPGNNDRPRVLETLHRLIDRIGQTTH